MFSLFCLDSSGPALRDISHFGYAAEDTPLRKIVLCLSELDGRCRFSVCYTKRKQQERLQWQGELYSI